MDRNKQHTHYHPVCSNWKHTEKRSIITPFCYIRHRDGPRDDNHLSAENKQPVSKEQQCFERNQKPKKESFQKVQLKKKEKEGLITVY